MDSSIEYARLCLFRDVRISRDSVVFMTMSLIVSEMSLWKYLSMRGREIFVNIREKNIKLISEHSDHKFDMITLSEITFSKLNWSFLVDQ